MRFLENQERIRRMCDVQTPADIFALMMAKSISNASLIGPRQHAIWKAYMMASEHARYFSTFNQFAGILGHSAFDRQMEFAEKLQRLQPLLNPEYVDNVSHLAGWANLTFEWYDITGQEISNDEEKQEALERIIEVLSDSETLDSPYVIGFYRIWKNIPNKVQFLDKIAEIICYFYSMYSLNGEIPVGIAYLTVARTLFNIYCLGIYFLRPAIKAGYEEKANAGKGGDNLE